jgi:4-hydroxy-tetrahydrodipicolinate reductase
MDLVICGDGRLGRAIATVAEEHGNRIRVLGRPAAPRHDPASFERADVVIEASRSEAVVDNVAAALDGGSRHAIIATTGWTSRTEELERLAIGAGATVVVAPNLSIGALIFSRLVERAASAFVAAPEFEPYLWEHHRRGKADRPSGTARELARRIAAVDPRQADIEITSVRAGASPGVHVVGFDAPGETIELRLTARDRSAYAAGALAAAEWLLAEPREPGLHPFDRVVDALIDPRPAIAVA